MAGVNQVVRVPVALGERSYQVVAGPLSDTLPETLAALRATPKVLLVSDERVAGLYADKVKKLLEQCGFSVHLAVVPVGEEAKSLAVAGRLYDQAVRCELDRKSLVVALGGGVVGDVAGFVAATYLRGLLFIQIPTTLLAQVDASVGGKVAINHPAGKNLIGAFYQPKAVLADVAFFDTLSERDYRSGLAEVVKHALLDSEARLQWLEANHERLLARDHALLQEVVAWCCAHKAGVVSRDETEQGERKHLNLGHTFGHAVEAWGGFNRWTHGESVAIGLVAALKLSVKHVQCPAALVARVAKLLEQLGLPAGLPAGETYDLQSYLHQDKKMLQDKIHWILLAGPGDVRICALDKNESVAELI